MRIRYLAVYHVLRITAYVVYKLVPLVIAQDHPGPVSRTNKREEERKKRPLSSYNLTSAPPKDQRLFFECCRTNEILPSFEKRKKYFVRIKKKKKERHDDPTIQKSPFKIEPSDTYQNNGKKIYPNRVVEAIQDEGTKEPKKTARTFEESRRKIHSAVGGTLRVWRDAHEDREREEGLLKKLAANAYSTKLFLIPCNYSSWPSINI